jgi:CRP-like cAMP-binding protein
VVVPEVFKDFPFFAGLTEVQLDKLANIAYEVTFLSDELIFNEGDRAHTLYVLLGGWLDIVVEVNAKGQHRQLITTLTTGEIFGWSAMVEPYVYTSSAVCASPVQAIGFDRAKLQIVFETDPKLCYTLIMRVCQVIASRLHSTRRQMASLFVMN